MLKVGLIGCGGIGAVHAECWLMMSEQVQLVAIADMNTERASALAKKANAKVYANADEMLSAETLDLVDICLPTFLHAEYMCKAMGYAKNVIVEKPVCLTEEEAQRILETEKETGSTVQVAQVTRFDEPYEFLKKAVDSGVYGKVIAGDFKRISPRPVWMRGHDDVRVSGSMALDLHIHDVDYIRFLLGEPDDVKTWTVKDKAGVIQHIWTGYQFGDAVVTAEGSWDYPTNLTFSCTFRVRLEKAALVLDEQGTLTVYPEEGEKFVPQLGETLEMDLGINVSNIGVYLKELKRFVTAVEQETGAVVSLADAVASFRLAQKGMKLAFSDI